MYKIRGIKFHVEKKVEENLQHMEPEIYQKLQSYKIKEDNVWMGYDDVIKLFRPDWRYGQTLEDKFKKLG